MKGEHLDTPAQGSSKAAILLLVVAALSAAAGWNAAYTASGSSSDGRLLLHRGEGVVINFGGISILGVAPIAATIDPQTTSVEDSSELRYSFHTAVQHTQLVTSCEGKDVSPPTFNYPVTGTSAGLAFAVWFMTETFGPPAIPNNMRGIAATGFVDHLGDVLSVNSLDAKIAAAIQVGVQTIVIPTGSEYDRTAPARHGVNVIEVSHVSELTTQMWPGAACNN